MQVSRTWVLDSGKQSDELRQDLTKTQERLADAVDVVENGVLYGAKVIGPITFTGATSVDVYHTLGWRLTGWVVIDRDTTATLINSSAATNDRRQYITLTSSGSLVATFLVF
jgi:hypothetical protein